MTSATTVASPDVDPLATPRSTAHLLESLGRDLRLDHYLSGRFNREQLVVLPQDVPNAGDRRAVADRAVASGVVVVLEPVWQRLGPMGR
jgi:hypothetical protein